MILFILGVIVGLAVMAVASCAYFEKYIEPHMSVTEPYGYDINGAPYLFQDKDFINK